MPSIQGPPPTHQAGHERFRTHISYKPFRFSEWSSTAKVLSAATILSIVGVSYNYFSHQRKNKRRNKDSNIPGLSRNLSSLPSALVRQNTVLTTNPDNNNEAILKNLSKSIEQSKKKHFSNDTSNILGHFTRVIVICVDSSLHSVNAVQWAQNNVLRSNDIVVLVNIWEKQNNFLTGIDDLDRGGLIRQSSTEVALETGLKLLDKLYENYLSKDEIESIPCILKKETNKKKKNNNEKNLEIAGTLLHSIKHIKPDMVIMGSRGLGIYGDKIKRDVNSMMSYEFGTVSNYVTQQVTCPCVVVPYVAQENKRQESDGFGGNKGSGISSILDKDIQVMNKQESLIDEPLQYDE